MSNFQPQPAWISASTAETDTRIHAFIRSVYAWMFGGLLLTAFASIWVVSSPAMKELVWGHRPLVWILMIAEFGLVVAISAGLRRFSAATAASMFLIYSLLNGLTLSAFVFSFTQASVFQAFVVTAGMFGAMSFYGLVTKRDLTSLRAFFFMGLIGLVLCMVVNMFLHSGTMAVVISFVGVFLFVGLTAYDTQKLKSFATVGGPMQEKLAIYGALALYLDFLNLFLFLLEILGSGNRRR